MPRDRNKKRREKRAKTDRVPSVRKVSVQWLRVFGMIMASLTLIVGTVFLIMYLRSATQATPQTPNLRQQHVDEAVQRETYRVQNLGLEHTEFVDTVSYACKKLKLWNTPGPSNTWYALHIAELQVYTVQSPIQNILTTKNKFVVTQSSKTTNGFKNVVTDEGPDQWWQLEFDTPVDVTKLVLVASDNVDRCCPRIELVDEHGHVLVELLATRQVYPFTAIVFKHPWSPHVVRPFYVCDTIRVCNGNQHNSNRKALNFAEFRVFDAAGNNIAQDTAHVDRVHQSSLYQESLDYTSAKAVDGDPTTHILTDSNLNEWWEIVFRHSVDVYKIEFVHRADDEFRRDENAHIQLWVSAQQSDATPILAKEFVVPPYTPSTSNVIVTFTSPW